MDDNTDILVLKCDTDIPETMVINPENNDEEDQE